MANTSSPFGFRLARRIDGAEPNYSIRHYPILYSNSNVIAYGDPVILTSGGYVDVSAPGTEVILGVFLGCSYYDTVQQKKVWSPQWHTSSAASGTAYANVCDDTKAIFEVQAGGSTTPITFADVGGNINYAQQSTPNGAGYSTAYADQTTIDGSIATRPFRIVGLSGVVYNNDPTSGYNTVEVILNNALFNSTTGV